MLIELRVRNFAIIDDLQVAFDPGFNVLTGETGAGKSILIDAIELLLGGKASQDMVRADTPSASVEGLFVLVGAAGQVLQGKLASQGLEGDDDSLILAREIRRGGRSVGRINGRAVAQSLLAEIGAYLIDIHGQGQHLSLLREREHIDLLDRFAGLQAQRKKLAQQVSTLRDIRNELEVLRRSAREIARRVDLLTYQVQEIDAAALTPEEDTALEGERRRLANAETLSAQSSAIYTVLVEGDNEVPAILDGLSKATGMLERLVRIDSDLSPLLGQAEDVFERVNELARAVSNYADTIAYDPIRLAEVEERLELIFQLKRKYGDTITEILRFGEKARAELDLLSQSETRTSDLEADEGRHLHAVGELASALSLRRQDASGQLAQAVELELIDLRMQGTRFQVEIKQKPDPEGCYVSEQRLAFDARGIDQVRFLISANPGEPLRPLATIASGGETARLMLALKNVLSKADATPTLIFDEIDQGIGGRVGAIVGRKLLDLSDSHQVLCVTHLPQIAAYGDQHLVVQKGIAQGRTVTHVQAVAEQTRVLELAAMLGANSEAGQMSAQELLGDVDRYKVS